MLIVCLESGRRTGSKSVSNSYPPVLSLSLPLFRFLSNLFIPPFYCSFFYTFFFFFFFLFHSQDQYIDVWFIILTPVVPSQPVCARLFWGVFERAETPRTVSQRENRWTQRGNVSKTALLWERVEFIKTPFSSVHLNETPLLPFLASLSIPCFCSPSTLPHRLLAFFTRTNSSSFRQSPRFDARLDESSLS